MLIILCALQVNNVTCKPLLIGDTLASRVLPTPYFYVYDTLYLHGCILEKVCLSKQHSVSYDFFIPEGKNTAAAVTTHRNETKKRVQSFWQTLVIRADNNTVIYTLTHTEPACG